MDEQNHCCQDECKCKDKIGLIASSIPIYISIYTIGRILEDRKVHGLSINFQILYIMALALKYMDDQRLEQLEIPEYLLIKRSLLIIMMVIFLMTLFFAKHDKFDVRWIAGGIFVSLVFTLDHVSFKFTAIDRWLIGSYLDAAAWTTLCAFVSKMEDDRTWFFILSIMMDPFTERVVFTGYDYYRDKSYDDLGYKLALLKLFLFLVWFVHQCRKTKKITKANNLIEVSSTSTKSIVCNPSEKCSDKPTWCIENEKNMSMIKEGLMSPN